MCEGGGGSYIALTTRRLFRAETTPLPAKKKLIKKYIKKKPQKKKFANIITKKKNEKLKQLLKTIFENKY